MSLAQLARQQLQLLGRQRRSLAVVGAQGGFDARADAAEILPVDEQIARGIGHTRPVPQAAERQAGHLHHPTCTGAQPVAQPPAERVLGTHRLLQRRDLQLGRPVPAGGAPPALAHRHLPAFDLEDDDAQTWPQDEHVDLDVEVCAGDPLPADDCDLLRQLLAQAAQHHRLGSGGIMRLTEHTRAGAVRLGRRVEARGGFGHARSLCWNDLLTVRPAAPDGCGTRPQRNPFDIQQQPETAQRPCSSRAGALVTSPESHLGSGMIRSCADPWPAGCRTRRHPLPQHQRRDPRPWQPEPEPRRPR